MTDVMDESVSWEQRREMRRKKRQELLAEADRLAQTSDTSVTRSSHEQLDGGEDDDFENERQKRRRDREERRKKEREEVEKQLKDEEEQRAERDRRREERRRQREELDCGDTPVESYTSSTTITKTVKTHDDRNNHEEVTQVVVETKEVIEEEYPVENGHVNVEEEEDVDMDQEEEEEDVDMDQEREKVDEDEEESEPQLETEETYSKSVTTVTVTKQKVPALESEEADTDEVKKKLSEIKLKREQSGRKKYAVADDDYDEEEHKARLKKLEEKRKLREQKQKEEEEREKEEAAKREADHQEQLRIEREERERRRAEAEAKRQEYRKQLTEDHDAGSSPLHPKNLTSPLVSKVEQLNKHITESPKSTKASPVQHVGKLDSRLEKYTKQASKQEVKKTSGTPGRVARDVTDRRNKWERGEVVSSDKSSTKKGAVATSGDVSSRKNLWESGKVGSPSVKSNKKADEVKGAGLSTRKDQWLKVTQQQDGGTKKSETPVTMKTGVLNRLNKWEKGEVALASTGSPDKAKAKTNLPASGVGDRRAKWENIGADPPKTSASQKKTHVVMTTDVSDRKHRFESKTDTPKKQETEEEFPVEEKMVMEEEEEPASKSPDRQSEEEDDEEGISLHSSDEQSDDFGKDESYSDDDE